MDVNDGGPGVGTETVHLLTLFEEPLEQQKEPSNSVLSTVRHSAHRLVFLVFIVLVTFFPCVSQ